MCRDVRGAAQKVELALVRKSRSTIMLYQLVGGLHIFLLVPYFVDEGLYTKNEYSLYITSVKLKAKLEVGL